MSSESVMQQRLLERSLEAVHNGVVICDARADDFPIVYVNPAFERITGYTKAEALGRNCRFLQGVERNQVGIEEIRWALQARREVHVVLRNFHKDGHLLWNELCISPVADAAGEVTHFIGVLNDVTERKRVESELSHTISHDSLTGLPNRVQLEASLEDACDSARRRKRKLAVLFVDLDGFKPVNDSLGHRVGDQLLVEAARRMVQLVRSGDVVARMGGDEFIVLLSSLDGEGDVQGVVERLVQCLGRPYVLEGQKVHLTASIGIALSDGFVEQPAQLIQQADLAMCKAKQVGRNNFQWYTDGLDHQISARLALRNELRKAIESGGLELHYQPQIDARSGRITCIEALLRWNHPERGYIPPAEFIRVAQDAGQLIPLNIWALEAACAFNKRLCDQGVPNMPVAVNISSINFKRGEFRQTVDLALSRSGLPAHLLELEVTESVFVEAADSVIDTLRGLKELGVKIVIDDFGTGYSSLGNLKRLPIDKVKLDRSFIKDIITDRHDANITQGIIAMAHHLRLQVVAEGVEAEAQHHFLRKIQCDAFQGFYFSRPLPGDELIAFLQTRRDITHPQPSAEDAKRQTVLLLDDEENILRALARVLRPDGYEVLMANRARDAFEILARNDVQVIISDQRMPEMCGTEFLSQVKGLYPDTVRIVLSGYTDLNVITDAINQGEIYKFLLKPWDDDNLRSVVAQAFRHFSANQGARTTPG